MFSWLTKKRKQTNKQTISLFNKISLFKDFFFKDYLLLTITTKMSTSCCSGAKNNVVISAVGPSILNCNFANIKAEVATLVEAEVDFVHLDVMDGHFVPDITFGPSFVQALVEAFPTQKFEVHMMVSGRPVMGFVKPMAEAGVCRYIFHYEATKEGGDKENSAVSEIIEAIHGQKMEASIALNPDTSVEKVIRYLPLLESVLVMTVVPGLGGQKFITSMLEKVTTIRTFFPAMDIELDGGVCLEVIENAGKAGANRVVVGTALLRSVTKAEDVTKMRKALYPN